MSVITVGNFDGVHLGHRALLRCVVEKARELGTSAMVLTFDRNTKSALQDNVETFLTDHEEREALLRMEGIDEVCTVSFDDAFMKMSEGDFLDYLRAYFCCSDLYGGSDFHFGFGGRGTLADGLFTHGIRQHVVDLKTDLVKISSTAIRGALGDGLIERANTWLGYPYSITGTVVEGRHIGSTIGFPTVNLEPREPKVLPKDGVYLTHTVIDGRVFPSMTNVGVRPTVGNDNERISETHLLSGGGDLYGRTITVRFLSRLRDEKKFSNLGGLMQQLRNDREEAFLRHKELTFR